MWKIVKGNNWIKWKPRGSSNFVSSRNCQDYELGTATFFFLSFLVLYELHFILNFEWNEEWIGSEKKNMWVLIFFLYVFTILEERTVWIFNIKVVFGNILDIIDALIRSFFGIEMFKGKNHNNKKKDNIMEQRILVISIIFFLQIFTLAVRYKRLYDFKIILT